MSDPVEIELKPLTDMITTMFGSEFVEFLKRQHGTVRGFYEKSTAITQCNNVVGKFEPNKSVCWICGLVIPPSSSPTDALAAECEHIFPIAQAIFFIGLYSNEIKDNIAFKNKLKLEYDWSHRVCNQIKNDSHFIEHNIKNPTGRWNINKDKIVDFLNEILLRGNTYDNGANKIRTILNQNNLRLNTWIAQRVDYIYRRCRDILLTIQPKNENLWILATVSDLADEYLNSGYEPEIIPPTLPTAKRTGFQPMTQSQVEAVYMRWGDFIMKKVNQFVIQYLAERLRRYSSEQKAIRSQKALMVLDRSLIVKIKEFIWPIYAQLPPDANKDVRFVEATSYIISKVVIERIDRIFADEKSPSIDKLRTFLVTSFIEPVTGIWNSIGFNAGLVSLDKLVHNSLKGARRRRVTRKRKLRS
jgi:hypothetical protein